MSATQMSTHIWIGSQDNADDQHTLRVGVGREGCGERGRGKGWERERMREDGMGGKKWKKMGWEERKRK